jgi:hypothetical protein
MTTVALHANHPVGLQIHAWRTACPRRGEPICTPTALLPRRGNAFGWRANSVPPDRARNRGHTAAPSSAGRLPEPGPVSRGTPGRVQGATVRAAWGPPWWLSRAGPCGQRAGRWRYRALGVLNPRSRALSARQGPDTPIIGVSGPQRPDRPDNWGIRTNKARWRYQPFGVLIPRSWGLSAPWGPESPIIGPSGPWGPDRATDQGFRTLGGRWARRGDSGRPRRPGGGRKEKFSTAGSRSRSLARVGNSRRNAVCQIQGAWAGGRSAVGAGA